GRRCGRRRWGRRGHRRRHRRLETLRWRSHPQPLGEATPNRRGAWACEHRGMTDLSSIAPAFVDMAHRIVWATVATVDRQGRPRGRVLEPYWQWDGAALTGLVATAPTALKRAHLAHSPFVSVTYWTPDHDTCTAECHATWILDDAGR